MSHLYLLVVECPLCGRECRFVEDRDEPVPLMQAVTLNAEHCPACGLSLPDHGVEWDHHEDARIERVPPVEEVDRGDGPVTDGGQVVATFRDTFPNGEPAVHVSPEIDPGETTATCSVCGVWGIVLDDAEIVNADHEGRLACRECGSGGGTVIGP